MSISKVFYRSPHNYDLDKASDEAAIPPGQQGVSLTIQSQTDDADLNVMMRRFGVTGQLPQATHLPSYGDYTQITDYRSALHTIMEAQQDFQTLPPELRARYQNDPQLFLEAVASGEALPALKEAGLIPTPTPPAPTAPTPSGS